MTEQEVKYLTTPAPRITKKKVLIAGVLALAAVGTLVTIINQVNANRNGEDSDTTES